MTKLDNSQVLALHEVQAQSDEYKARVARLQEQFDEDKITAQADLVTAVQNAFDLGVPKRRIHIEGLGTKDSKTLSDMLGAGTTGGGNGLATTGIRKVDDVYIVTDSRKREWEFWLLDLGDSQVVERSNTTEHGNDTEALTVTPEVFTILRAKFPRADFTSFLDEE